VNNRNLRTLAVDVEASYRLAAKIPAGTVAVSESGLQTRDDLERLSAAGYRAFLIGERFMTDRDPAAAIRALIGMPNPEHSTPNPEHSTPNPEHSTPNPEPNLNTNREPGTRKGELPCS
jgi:indole-3-glycerol phosphate synthase